MKKTLSKKIVAILLFLTLVIALFGCANNDIEEITGNSTGSDGAEDQATAEQTSDELTSTELEVSAPGEYPIVDQMVELTYFCANLKPNIEDMETNKMTEWYEEYTNVHINWIVPPSGEESTKLNLSLASGDYPDAYWSTALNTAQVILYASSGVIIPLNDLIEEHGYHLKQSFEERPAVLEKLTAPDGNIYSLYRMDDSLHGKTQQKMFVYQPWLDKLGIESPTTTQEFADMLQTFKDQDMNENGDTTDEIPLMGYATTGSANIAWFLMNPFVLCSENSKLLNVMDGKVVPAYIQDEWKEGILYIRDLYERGLIAKDSFVQDTNQLKALVNNADEPIVGASTGMYELIFSSLDSLPNALELYNSIEPLVGPTGLQQTPYYDSLISLNTFITSSCEYPEIVLKWNDYWFSYEGGLTNAYGFEDEQYIWSDELSISGETPSIKTIQKVESTQNDWWYASGPRFQTADMRYLQTNIPGALEPELYAEAQNYLSYFPEEYMPGILWMEEQEANDISVLESNIWSYVNESLTKFITGDMDVEIEWNNYLEELENMGLSKYVELYQDILDKQ